MKIIETYIKDLVILEPKVYNDERGHFMESYKNSWFKSNFPNINFIQDNESKSYRNVLRGLHFQKPPFEQTKLVRVISGEVLDVAIDLRKKSKSYGMYFKINLSGHNKKQLLIPKGFAHGFLVLSDEAIFSYKVDNVYDKDSDAGLPWNDSILNIDWGLPKNDIIVSKKDSLFKDFNHFQSPF